MSSDLHLVLHQQDKIQLMEHFYEYVYQLKSVIDTQFSMTDLRAEVEDLLDDYNRMLHFFACASKDPNALSVFSSLVERLLKLEHHVELERAISSNQVFKAAAIRINGADLMSILQRLEQSDASFEDFRKAFDAVLVSHQWNSTISQYVTTLLVEEKISQVAALMIESAMMLACLVSFDLQKSETLLSVYQLSACEAIRQRALIGLALSMPWSSIYAADMKEKLLDGQQVEQVKKDLQSLQKQIFLCQQTSSVSADIDKNIMPDLIKLSHNGYKMMKSNVLEDTSVEEIVDSEMEDRLMDKLDKTMEKMQVRRDAGLDVNYSTFSKMKNYAFFHRFSNWFVPFTIDHPDMSQLKKALGDKADFMISIAGSTMSEGDKYSLLFSLQDVLERMPQYKDMIFPKSVNPPKSEDFDFLQNDAVALRRNYLQDLYRFFQLAPMRNGFPNPFVNESNSWIDPAFLSSDVFTDFDDLDDVHLSVCRFLAKSKNYVELNHYLRNFSLDSDDGVVLKALCMMHVKKRYDIAVFLLKPIFDKNPGNVAVGKLLVKCYLQQDKYKEALDIFDALSDKLGDNPSLLLSKIDCLRSTYLYSEALKVAYELDYKYPNNRMYMLLLVRVLLDNNEIEKAGEELNKLVMMLQEEKVDDYNEELFLLGIIEWCRGHLKDAQDSMRGYALVNKDNRNKVFSRIAEFKRLLLGHNVTQVEYAMMLNLIDNHFTAK